MKRSIVIRNAQRGHSAYASLWHEIKASVMAGHVLVVSVKPETRSDAANRRMWAMLTEISEQVLWHGQKLSPEEFKHIFSAALERQKVVPGLEGGFVVLGQSTSKMTKAEISDLMALMEAFGAERNVRFSAPGA